jgi:hypothetical protein
MLSRANVTVAWCVFGLWVEQSFLEIWMARVSTLKGCSQLTIGLSDEYPALVNPITS